MKLPVSPHSSLPKRIFLIDDERLMTDFLGAALCQEGFDLIACNDPQAALDRLLVEDCDAIVVDLMMPRLDGLTVISRLRASTRHERTPLLVLSARTLTDRERKALVTCGARWLSKPVTPQQLVAAVRSALA